MACITSAIRTLSGSASMAAASRARKSGSTASASASCSCASSRSASRSRRRFTFRIALSETVTAMRCTQVEKAESPLNWASERKTLTNTSCVRSSARSGSPHTRYVRRCTRAACLSYSARDAARSPTAARAISERSSSVPSGEVAIAALSIVSAGWTQGVRKALGAAAAAPSKVRELGSSALRVRVATLGVRIATLLLSAMIPAAVLGAQGTPPHVACNGQVITGIDIHSYLAGSSFAADAWHAASGFAGMHETPTRPEVIRAYLRMKEGERCTELDRRESERLLRAQRFISSATVQAVPDGPGRVRLVVETVDEVPALLGGSFQGTQVAA